MSNRLPINPTILGLPQFHAYILSKYNKYLILQKKNSHSLSESTRVFRHEATSQITLSICSYICPSVWQYICQSVSSMAENNEDDNIPLYSLSLSLSHPIPSASLSLSLQTTFNLTKIQNHSQIYTSYTPFLLCHIF